MKLTVLGCSGSMSGPRSAASSYLVQAGGSSVVLDLGPGGMGRLLAHMVPCDLGGVAISHMHADHMVDLVGLHVYCRWYPDCTRTEPLPIFGASNCHQRILGVGGDGPEEQLAEFDFRPMTHGSVMRFGEITVEAFAVNHTVEAYALRVTGPSEDGDGMVTLTYSGDTDTCDGLVDAARDADLFLCEAAFQEGRDTVRGVHLTGRRAGDMARLAGVRRLVLTHLQPWNDPEVTLAEARETYRGPLEVAVADATYTL